MGFEDVGAVIGFALAVEELMLSSWIGNRRKFATDEVGVCGESAVGCNLRLQLHLQSSTVILIPNFS